MNEGILDSVREFVKKEFEKPEAEYKGSYEGHFKIVVRSALELANRFNADKEIVEIAAWLHDIGSIRGQRENHHIVSANISEELLKELKYPKEKIDRVIHCILTHRASLNLKRETIEAKIIADADAMSHFDDFENVVSGACKGDRRKALEKVERSYLKLSEEIKPLLMDKLNKIRQEELK